MLRVDIGLYVELTLWPVLKSLSKILVLTVADVNSPPAEAEIVYGWSLGTSVASSLAATQSDVAGCTSVL